MNRKALVTGASSGIGEALCRLLAQKGISLILHGRNTAKLISLQKELEVSAQIITADLTQPSDRKQLLKILWDEKPDLVVNNAGIGAYGCAADIDREKQSALIDLNVKAATEITVEAFRMMKENRIQGTILNVSSVASFTLFPYFAAYAASKAFLTTFSESLYFEAKPFGIHILTSCPGRVATPFQQHSLDSQEKIAHSSASMDVSYAAHQIWKQIESKKRLHIFSPLYRLSTWLLFIVPKPLRGVLLGCFMQKFIRTRSNAKAPLK